MRSVRLLLFAILSINLGEPTDVSRTETVSQKNSAQSPDKTLLKEQTETGRDGRDKVSEKVMSQVVKQIIYEASTPQK
ncbi:MAG: hypothetical protein NZT61_02820 [Deltaproteobacteria bacterium]|nr:hypothetical protein [Deltaproteobacteria bacterium]MCX7952693.1 hypothetical protein [Deltaproteobacteria bacterium]